jgi:hypothetical protein
MVVKKRGVKIKGFRLHIMPHGEIQNLSIQERVKKLLKLVLGNRVIVLQGRLRAEEEIRLIEDTMAMVDHVKDFKGIELAVIEHDMKEAGLMYKLRRNLAKSLVGDQSALTVIGPAAVVKDIRRDPKKLEVFFS